MSDTEYHSHLPTYTKIIVLLSALTFAEFGIALNMAMPQHPEGAISFGLGAAVLLVLTVAKAWCVGMFFMHLKYDAKALSWIILSPVVLATPFVILAVYDAIHGYAG